MFASEDARLSWLIGRVEASAASAGPGRCEAEDLAVFQVTGSWLARCLDLVKGLVVLVQEEHYAPACVVRRAIWELWIDWRYLLRFGDRRLNAAKALLCAQVETLEFVGSHRDAFDGAHLEKLRQNLSEFESRNAQASAAVREQRRKRRFHWSGLSYSKMETALGGGPGIYKPLSWEVHGIVAAMRDVQLDMSDNTVLFQFGQTDSAYPPDRLLYSAGGVLFYVYNEFADMWGLPAVELPRDDSCA